MDDIVICTILILDTVLVRIMHKDSVAHEFIFVSSRTYFNAHDVFVSILIIVELTVHFIFALPIVPLSFHLNMPLVIVKCHMEYYLKIP